MHQGEGGAIDFYDGYDVNAECIWTIVCPAGLGVGIAPSLTFTQLDTEQGHDWVDVFDGVPTCRDDGAGLSAAAGVTVTCLGILSSGQCPLHL